jgi:hypothetical protein
MGKPLVWAVLGVVVLGAGAMVIVYALTRPSPPGTASASLTAPIEQTAPTPASAAAPAPPAVVPPEQQVVTEPVRAAPVAAPEYKERLESSDVAEREDAMLQMREQRRAKQMERLNRRSRR